VDECKPLHLGVFQKFQQETLFYIFYSMPGDEAQLYAADELVARGWGFHKVRPANIPALLPYLLKPHCSEPDSRVRNPNPPSYDKVCETT